MGTTRLESQVTFVFNVLAGRTYSVLHREALDDAHPWTRLANIPAQTVSGPFTFTDPLATSPGRFYRVVSPAWP